MVDLARRKYLPNPEQSADDALQHAREAFLRKRPNVEAAKVPGYLYMCARNYLMDLLRAKRRERRSGTVELDRVLALAGPAVLDPLEKLLQQEAEEEMSRRLAITRSALAEHLSSLTHPLARDSIRAIIFGDITTEDVVARHDVARSALNHHVDKLHRQVAVRLGALESYLAARAKRRRRPRK